jgi:hypothetical protein
VVILDTLDFGVPQLEKSSDILEAHVVQLGYESRQLCVIVVRGNIVVLGSWAKRFARELFD